MKWWQSALDWNAIYLENHDQPRSVSRFADDQEHQSASAKMLAVLLLTLPAATNTDALAVDQG